MAEKAPVMRLRPGRIVQLRGIAFQNDGASTIGRIVIRPLESLDRWIAGIPPSAKHPPLAMHAGLHVVLEDGREFVVEQLVGSFAMDFRNGLNWTPLDVFRRRDRGGWDLTVPPLAFRGVDDQIVADTIERLNSIIGRPFVGEDCTAFIERAFGGRRLFADSPLLTSLGIGARIGDPALALLEPGALVDAEAREQLHADALEQLPDPEAHADSPNVRVWLVRLTAAALIGWSLVEVFGPLVLASYGAARRSPISNVK